MGGLVRKIFSNASTRILVMIFVCIIGITSFFLIFGYFNQLELYKQAEYKRLQAIAKTSAISIDGDAYQELFTKYKKKGDLKTIDQDSAYQVIFNQLYSIQLENELPTSIYTITRVEKKNEVTKFCYGVNARPDFKPEDTFRDEYVQYPKVLNDQYLIGSTIPEYKSENGHWLSAFHPLTNREGEVVGVVEADIQFDPFIHEVLKQILYSSIISIFVILIIALLIIRSIKKILKKEEEMTESLVLSSKIIEEKNKDITDSINYAKKIQNAILPTADEMTSKLPNSFIYFQPRDIVSGDFFWCAHQNGRLIVIGADCTGHGVPGALMSMIGSSLLNEIINHRKETNPGRILDLLDEEIVKSFENKHGEAESKDGMDLAICSIDLENKTLEFAGAFRPLWIIRDDQVVEIKGNRFPIGGGPNYNKTAFTSHNVELQENDFFYLFSDGYPDQFGGEKGKKFMNKRLKELMLSTHQENNINRLDVLRNAFNEWKGDLEQIDDVLVIGFGL